MKIEGKSLLVFGSRTLDDEIALTEPEIPESAGLQPQQRFKTLTAGNVNEVFMDCLFRDGEDTSKAVVAEGVMQKFGFHPDRLEAHKTEIREMLECLPDDFQPDKGGGTSFLNACMTKEGEQWGEHSNIEQLLALGIATKQAAMLMPREMWNILPGGMPYIGVTARTANASNEAERRAQR